MRTVLSKGTVSAKQAAAMRVALVNRTQQPAYIRTLNQRGR